ncbi:MAG: cysteine desulfurase [Acidobacteria bacterium]|nr:cysteine desulfurase [Acidobacteriota bacterium]
MKTARGIDARESPDGGSSCDVQRIREDFPILKQLIHGKPLVYLDNAATTQKPRQVIESIVSFYSEECSNVHRGVHLLSERATRGFEATRSSVRRFIHARDDREIVFVRGATEAINLVACSYGRAHVRAGDEVLVTAMEHHSNIVPWQMLCAEKGAKLRVAPMNSKGELLLEEYERLLGPRTCLVAVTHVSNALGTVNPLHEIVEMAHRNGAVVLVDGAQAVQHMRVDVQALDCDFYVFSGHKIYGPTGIGVLYGRERLLESMPPYQGGGDMIASVTFEKTVYNKLPYKFEAGTPDIAGVIGLGAAIDYLQSVGIEKITSHEQDLLHYGTSILEGMPEIRILGTAAAKTSVLSFTVQGIHPHDVGTILDQEGIAIRTGHHCAQPVMDFFGVPATARASLALYNTRDELDALAAALRKVIEVFS